LPEQNKIGSSLFIYDVIISFNEISCLRHLVLKKKDNDFVLPFVRAKREGTKEGIFGKKQ
jgi:hypothetical protein